MLLEDTRGYLKSFVDTEAERMPVNLWCWFPENSGVSICNEEAKGSSPTVAWTPPLISRWTYYGRSRSPSTRYVDNHSSSDIPSDGGWFPPWLIFFSWAFQGAVFAKQIFWRRSWRPGRLECTVIYLPRVHRNLPRPMDISTLPFSTTRTQHISKQKTGFTGDHKKFSNHLGKFPWRYVL